MQHFFHSLMSSGHTNVALLAFIPGLINLGIFIYIYYFFPRSRLSINFSAVVLSAFVWQMGEGFLRITSDLHLANHIYDIIDSGSLLLVASTFYFSLLFTKTLKNKSNSFIITLTYLPALFFIIANVIEWIPSKLEYTSSLGYVNMGQGALFTMESLYISAFGLAAAFMLIKHWIKSNKKNEKIKACLITVGYLIPLIQGLTTEIMFPELLNMEPIPLTTSSITFFSIASIIALKKYDLLSFSPYMAYEKIINDMSDAIVITDANHVIKYVNPALLNMIHYEEEELMDKQSYFLLADTDSVSMASEMREKRKTGSNDRYEVNMKTKEGNIINVHVSASPYYSNNKIIGSIAILNDITREKIKTKELTEAMIQGEEKERKRLAQDLHDGISQSLATLKMNVQVLKPDVDEDRINPILQLADETIKEVRTISHNLIPLNENALLCDVIKKLINRFESLELKFNLNITGDKPSYINPATTTNIYRVLQEFINNSIKYSKANLISINMHYGKQSIKIEIKDNGCGFDYELAKNTASGIGLQNMKQRIKIIDGIFDLQSKINSGTCLTIDVPY